MNKKIKLVVMVICVSSLLCSCGEKLEIRDRAFVQSIGIESYDGGYSICLRIFEDEQPYKGKGATFNEAVDDAEKVQGKDFFTGHTEAVIVRDDQSANILGDLINNDISAGCLVIYDTDPVAFVDENDTEKILDMISTAVRNKKIKKVNICDVINQN